PSIIGTPTPGVAGGNGTHETSTLSYDSLGNVIQLTGSASYTPGTPLTSTAGYTADGADTQAAAIGQPLAVTNPLGKTTHFRYDTQGRAYRMWDALGIET